MSIALPVSLGSFTAASFNNCGIDVRLNSILESSLKVYEIERITCGINFELIKSLLPTGGNSTYTFTDNNAVSDVNYYRLVLIDLNGDNSISNIVSANDNCMVGDVTPSS